MGYERFRVLRLNNVGDKFVQGIGGTVIAGFETSTTRKTCLSHVIPNTFY
jgi:hypothetical protein